MSLSHRLSVPKKQRKFYSGKKKKHTLKTQVIFNPKLKQIVSIQIEDGRKHDLTIARKYLKEMVIYPCIMADLAYKGFHQIKSKLLIPIKKPKNLSLPQIAKQINQEISLMRIRCRNLQILLNSMECYSQSSLLQRMISMRSLQGREDGELQNRQD